jgi:glucokinase
MRLLAGDVGGTKTLLRCVEPSGATSAEQRYRSGDYKTFDALLRDFIQRVEGPVDGACFAVAGPVFAGTAEVTNVGWNIAEGELASAFGIARVSLINDFYAVALGVPLLRDEDLLSLHGGTRDRTAPMAVLGAGTGLGEAMVAYHRGEHFVLPTEGGHADFAPQDEEHSRLFVHLQKQLGGHVSWERVLSGMGLTNIFTFLGGAELAPAEIAKLAEQGDERGVRTFRMFVDSYGAEAGNMALRVLARGGVFLAGGIAAKNQRWFTDGRFVEAFLRKGRFRDVLESIPVDLIVNEQVGLIGAVEGARRALESALPLFR